MASIPGTAELMSTIVRLGQKYLRDGNATALVAVYEKLFERFEGNLTEEQDVLLSKAAALMVSKYWVEQAA